MYICIDIYISIYLYIYISISIYIYIYNIYIGIYDVCMYRCKDINKNFLILHKICYKYVSE